MKQQLFCTLFLFFSALVVTPAYGCLTPQLRQRRQVNNNLVCLYAQPNYGGASKCLKDVAPDYDFANYKGFTGSARLFSGSSLLVFASGNSKEFKNNVPDLRKEFPNMELKFFKTVRAPVVNYKILEIVYRKTNINGKRAEFTEAHIQQLKIDLTTHFPFWIKWLSNGIVQMHVDFKVLDTISKASQSPAGAGRGLWISLNDVPAGDLPKKGQYDGVQISWNSQPKGQPALDDSTFWTSPEAESRGFGYSSLMNRGDLNRDGFTGGPLAGYVHEWLHQVENIYAFVTPNMKPGDLHDTPDRRDNDGQAPLNHDWYRWYRAYFTNEKKGLGIQLASWKTGSLLDYWKRKKN